MCGRTAQVAAAAGATFVAKKSAVWEMVSA